MAAAFSDLDQWSALVAERIEAGQPPEMATRGARLKIAAERRERWPHLRTWKPGDGLPEIFPSWGVYDVDGRVWFWRADGRMHLSAADRAAGRRNPIEQPLEWVELLETRGPVTVRQAPGVQGWP